MLIEALKPLRLRLPDGNLELGPGTSIELVDHFAQRLLRKAGGKVRIVPAEITIEPASVSARAVFWEAADGRILGPARQDFLAQVGSGMKNTDFWVIGEFEGQPRWIRSDRLRSKRAFDTQRPVQMIDFIGRAQ